MPRTWSVLRVQNAAIMLQEQQHARQEAMGACSQAAQQEALPAPSVNNRDGRCYTWSVLFCVDSECSSQAGRAAARAANEAGGGGGLEAGSPAGGAAAAAAAAR